MIEAVAWFCEAHCGVWMPGKGERRLQCAPKLTTAKEVTTLVGRPVKYFSRMTDDAQRCVCAAGLALQGAAWDAEGREIGVLAAGYEGFLEANREYFADYVAGGRKLGRASLFVYTLPTSAACAASMALRLTGPLMHVEEEAGALEALARHASAMLVDGEAEGMLALWSDRRAAVCLAIGAGEGIGYSAVFRGPVTSPWQLAQDLQAMKSMP